MVDKMTINNYLKVVCWLKKSLTPILLSVVKIFNTVLLFEKACEVYFSSFFQYYIVILYEKYYCYTLYHFSNISRIKHEKNIPLLMMLFYLFHKLFWTNLAELFQSLWGYPKPWWKRSQGKDQILHQILPRMIENNKSSALSCSIYHYLR